MMNDLVGELAHVVEQLALVSESGKEDRKAAKVLTEALTILDMYPISDGDRVTIDSIQDLADELMSKSGGKTDQTDKLRNRVRGLVEAEILPEDEQVTASELVARYNTITKAKGSGQPRGESQSEPDMPFGVKAYFGDDLVWWEGKRVGHGRWNSLRHYCTKYEKDTLGHAERTGNGEWKTGGVANLALLNGESEVVAGLFRLVKV
jgi:hypothetical protein